MLESTTYPKFDYLFAGAGASATLLLMSMERRGLLKNKKILVIDPDSKIHNDKTYCFWAKPTDEISINCKHLISQKWEEMCVNGRALEPIKPLEYMQIASIDVYHEMRRILENYHIQRIQTNVVSIEAINEGLKVITEEGVWQSAQVFDSRPPTYLTAKKNEVHLKQSFIGFVVQPENKEETKQAIDLMDFRIEQQGYTQFIYVLPYDSGKILVELTRFGKEILDPISAEPILNEYITKRFGTCTVSHIETGCIPMSTLRISENTLPGLIAIGGRNGAIKPSTGYAFKNMFKHAEKLAEGMQMAISPIKQESPKRFRFYDRLLLLILNNHPEAGSGIFKALFDKNKLINVLQFLDEKTSLSQDIRILISLPIKPFLIAWHLDAKVRFQYLAAPIFLFLFTLVLWAIHIITPSIFEPIQIGIFTTGLFFLGIPHGAVDHLLVKEKQKQNIRLTFVISYLSKAFALLLLWLFVPNLALLFFLLYSAWHFGEADMHEWQFKKKRTLNNWVWGILLLGILLLGHLPETNQILGNMKANTIPLTNKISMAITMVLGIISILWAYWERRLAMFISATILLVCVQLPLITSFGIYFIGQHSLNGWTHIKKGLHLNNKQVFVKALPFNLAAFILFGVLLYYFNSFTSKSTLDEWMKTFFIFISCISFPHIIAMNKFYQLIGNQFFYDSKK